MNKFMLFCAIIFSSSLLAADSYKLDMKLLFDGKAVANPKLVVEKGKEAMLSHEDNTSGSITKINILASDAVAQDQKAISLKLKISKDDKIISRPEVLVSEGKTATFETVNEKGQKMILNITANRMTF